MKKILASAALAIVALAGTSYARGLTYYRTMTDPASLQSIDLSRPPRAFHVKGIASSDGKFEWGKKVEGKGKLCADGKDWLNLNDGKIHAAGDNAKPTGPYVVGCKAGNTLTPSSLEVLQ